jgi:hypothetical protein
VYSGSEALFSTVLEVKEEAGQCKRAANELNPERETGKESVV